MDFRWCSIIFEEMTNQGNDFWILDGFGWADNFQIFSVLNYFEQFSNGLKCYWNDFQTILS